MPLETTSGFGLQFEKKDDITIALDDIKKVIASDTPEEVGLNDQVISALLFQKNSKPGRARIPGAPYMSVS